MDARTEDHPSHEVEVHPTAVVEEAAKIGQPLERALSAIKTALSLPLHPGMTEYDVERVADALRSALHSTPDNGP